MPERLHDNADFARLYAEAEIALKKAGRAPHGHADVARVAEELVPDLTISGREAQRYAVDSARTLRRVLALVSAQAALGDPGVLRQIARLGGYELVERAESKDVSPAGMIAGAATGAERIGKLIGAMAEAWEDGRLSPVEAEGLLALLAPAEEALATLRKKIHRAARPLLHAKPIAPKPAAA